MGRGMVRGWSCVLLAIAVFFVKEMRCSYTLCIWNATEVEVPDDSVGMSGSCLFW